MAHYRRIGVEIFKRSQHNQLVYSGRQRTYFVAVFGEVDGRRPTEIGRFDMLRGKLQFGSSVFHFTNVLPYSREAAHTRYRHVEQQIARLVEINISRYLYPVVQKPDIQPDIPRQ